MLMPNILDSPQGGMPSQYSGVDSRGSQASNLSMEEAFRSFQQIQTLLGKVLTHLICTTAILLFKECKTKVIKIGSIERNTYPNPLY